MGISCAQLRVSTKPTAARFYSTGGICRWDQSGMPCTKAYCCYQLIGAAPDEQWEEVGDQVGSHPSGLPARTVEQLFAACRATLGPPPPTDPLTLVVNQYGVPTQCFYTPPCIDSPCDVGYSLGNFRCGP